MPTYEYLCGSCDHHFEQVQKISEDALTECPVCKKNELKRIINATAFHLKGSGWYKTDYASGSNTSSAPTPSTSTTTETASVAAKKDENKAATKPAVESTPAKPSTNTTESSSKS